MSVWQMALAIGALVVLAISFRVPRAALWIGVAAANFAAATAWQRLGIPHHAAGVFGFDALTCLLIYGLAQEQWEVTLFNIFRLSVLISILRLFGIIGDATTYVVCLELCNWSVLGVIGGTAIMGRAPSHGSAVWSRRRFYLHWIRLHLCRARRPDPWFKVRH